MKPTTVALGIDIGPTRSGAALVELDANGWVHIVWGGHVETAGRELRQQIENVRRIDAVFAVETIQGFAYQSSRVAQLIETARAEGDVIRMAVDMGLSAERFTAPEWRGELCRSKTASDDQIRIAIEGICITRPTLKADARPHVYDAAGVAIVALARELGRKLVLPAHIEMEIHRQREREKSIRESRKARGEVAPAEKRRPTRAQTKKRSEASKKSWEARR